MRISGGTTIGPAETTNQYVRCIWPSQRRDVLEGRSCYGPPASECFVTSGGLVDEKYDRAAVDMAAAIEYCRASGGHLPALREVLDLIHGGAPNGSDSWVWANEAESYFNGSSQPYGHDVVKWSGVGTDRRECTTNAGSWSYGHDLHRFYCGYSPELR